MQDILIIDQVKQAIENVRPFAQQHGGDIEYVMYENGTVSVQLHGACSSCAISSLTLKLGIEERLKEQIPQIKEVIAI
jgi:Fe-S cluster biogenesis protein NfuA